MICDFMHVILSRDLDIRCYQSDLFGAFFHMWRMLVGLLFLE